MAIAAADPSPAAVMTWARGLVAFPAAQTPGTLVAPVASTWTQPVSRTVQPRSMSRVSLGTLRSDEHGGAGHDAATRYDDTGEVIVVDGEADDGLVDDADGAGDELFALGRSQGGAVGEQDNVVGPQPDEVGVRQGLGGGGLVAGQDTDGLVGDFVAVAVGAVEEVASPSLADAGDVGDPVSEAGGHQYRAGLEGGPVDQSDLEPEQGVG